MIKPEHIQQLEEFKKEIDCCYSKEDALDIAKRIETFYEENDIPEEEDPLVESGMCEMLGMMIQ